MVAGPLLAVIEAPTGEGKTEAALALAWRLGACDGLDELFFALPTMATSNQMFGRLSHFYNDLYGAAVQLTHSQSAIVKDDLRRAALAGDQDAAEPLAASALAAIEWFAGSKKAMLAPFGVGTVDQVELAGLNVRHYVLRLLALAKKVVIIDEVHAYDAYMSVIPPIGDASSNAASCPGSQLCAWPGHARGCARCARRSPISSDLARLCPWTTPGHTGGISPGSALHAALLKGFDP
jgi:hypothetical protein